MTYRQGRISAAFAALVLVVMAVLLGLTPHAPGATGRFLGLRHDHVLSYLSTLIVAVPALIGAFWGAPILARELETGTYRLAWTQGVTRTRWLATKLGLYVVLAVICSGVYSVMLTHWSSASISRGRMQPAMFAERGIVPIGYSVFGLCLGVSLGVVIRRTVPAMAATLIGFTAVRMLTQFELRSHLAPLRHLLAPAVNGVGILQTSTGVSVQPPLTRVRGGWVISRHLVDGAGQGPTAAFVTAHCPTNLSISSSVQPAVPPPGLVRCQEAVAAHFRVAVAYQPGSHYWWLQGGETGVFLAFAAALAAFTFWWVRTRLT